MPSRSWQFRINDILAAIDKIERYTKDMDVDTWFKDEKTVDAVIRNLEVNVINLKPRCQKLIVGAASRRDISC